MRLFYGPYQALRRQFTDYAASLHAGPQRRVLVLCPSGRLAAALRRELTEKTGFVSNVFFTNFRVLIEELDREGAGARLPLLPGDNLHDYILKRLLSRPELERYRPSRGFVSALRASLRDMADALVDPDVLDEHLLGAVEDPLLRTEQAHLRWLAAVYRAYTYELDHIAGYRSYRQYFEHALEVAADSAYLRSFSEILVYGFYELTGRQLELFNALRAHYPVTAFWLYADHPAFAFSKKFFETNILGAAQDAVQVPADWSQTAARQAAQDVFTPSASVQTPKGLRVVSAPNPQGELYFAVKEMLRLHEEQGLAYEDMALCARTLEPYKTAMADVFEQNGVPLKADLTFYLPSRPLGVFLLNLLGLLRGGFYREDILAVVTSPYFKRKNDWRFLIDESLARRDFAQWTDLVRPTLKHYDPAFLKWLEECRRQLEFLNSPLPWDALQQAAWQFLQDNVDAGALDEEEKAVWDGLRQTLYGFSRFAAAAPRAQQGEFLDELLSALHGLELRQGPDMQRGVSALDALSLRGLGFKAVFLLGMNERVFPQLVFEDPVLKDYYRRILRDQLGFWLNQKLERFDEERLLFFTALTAASDKIYLSFRRSDEEGKPLVPSGYLAELARAARLSLDGPQVERLPARASLRLRQTELTLLTREEVSYALAARGADEADFKAAGLLEPQVSDALAAAGQIASSGALTARDGQLKSGEAVWAAQDASGLSPSSLQDLARCPMKYFFAKGAGLREPEEALSRTELAPDARGRAYHEILMDFYQDLYKNGLTGQLFGTALQERLHRAVDRRFHARSYRAFGIYPVIWELILEDIRTKLTDFVLQDAQHLGGYIPAVFEQEFEKIYPLSPHIKMRLKGIVDRIDVDATNKTFRVIDYKSGRHGGKDLAADMFKRVILQPYIYLILTQQQPQTRGLQPDGAALLNINKGYNRQELTQEGFESVRPRAEKFLQMLAVFIQSGRFFLNTGEHCQYCPYAAICRRDAFKSLLRARRSAASLELEEAKQ